MTVKEFLEGREMYSPDIENVILEYAKIKCQELLFLVAEKARVTTIWDGNTGSEYIDYDVDRKSILNAIDLDSFIV